MTTRDQLTYWVQRYKSMCYFHTPNLHVTTSSTNHGSDLALIISPRSHQHSSRSQTTSMRNSTRWHNDQLSTLLLLSASILKCHIVHNTCSEVASSESSVFYLYINLNPGPVYLINIFVGIPHELIQAQNFINLCESVVHWTVQKNPFAHTHSSRLRTMLMLPSYFTFHRQTVNSSIYVIHDL